MLANKPRRPAAIPGLAAASFSSSSQTLAGTAQHVERPPIDTKLVSDTAAAPAPVIPGANTTERDAHSSHPNKVSPFVKTPVHGASLNAQQGHAAVAEQPQIDNMSHSAAATSVKAPFGLHTRAINLPEFSTRLPKIAGPPEIALSVEELEADRALFASLAERRGERRRAHGTYRDEAPSDEDINGFANTAEGQRFRKKVRVLDRS